MFLKDVIIANGEVPLSIDINPIDQIVKSSKVVIDALGVFEAEPIFKATNNAGKFLDVRFEHSDVLWPWSGFLALYIYVREEASSLADTATGEVSFTIVSPPMPEETEDRRSLVTMPLTVEIIPTPPR